MVSFKSADRLGGLGEKPHAAPRTIRGSETGTFRDLETAPELLLTTSSLRLLRLPPFLSLLCLLVGVAWLLLLPLDAHSRSTYVSENALLPGQVHTYFGGSEHNVFRAYRHEVAALAELPDDHAGDAERIARLRGIFKSAGLKVATQEYGYETAVGREVKGENVYAVLQGPRADATEAIVLMAAWRNMAGELNHSGVALVLTLARYFKRWSLWSKDIIFLITPDSIAGPQAWADAYHSPSLSSSTVSFPNTNANHNAANRCRIEPLPLKAGALQGALAVDYPAGPWGHRFDKLHLVYEGANGALPNLDLVNTAVNIARGQLGIGVALQRVWNARKGGPAEVYEDRLAALLRGVVAQGVGVPAGPHAAFIPYRVDAVTLQAVGDGWHDEMGLGRTVEGLCRSLNNLLEHLHQSFFFYFLVSTERFVSIGTYLPAAMVVAAGYTIMAIALWVGSGRLEVRKEGAETEVEQTTEKTSKASGSRLEKKQPDSQIDLNSTTPSTDDRPIALPLAFVVAVHATGLIPLYLFNHLPASLLLPLYVLATVNALVLPALTAAALRRLVLPAAEVAARQFLMLVHAFSLLLAGLFLSALATINFSQSLMLGLVGWPAVWVPTAKSRVVSAALYTFLQLLSPPAVLAIWAAWWTYSSASTMAAPKVWNSGVDRRDVPDGIVQAVQMVLVRAAEAWHVSGVWTPVVVWLVWWPCWVVAAVGAGVGWVR
ncbi:Gaa1-like protein [Lineolata rhizophorae]|uniref:Gaa1-like protein n=1 Tax=Lineolata rhizophorae TaxID=578093 RepID=A0A6A6P6D6_9PEZI|nr:Gaa1-like protein [Lineolata rhizophorae]